MADEALPVRPGEVIGGRYRVERVLGRGGMAVVVAARHKDLDELVAIKIMLRHRTANQDVRERFAREARAAVKIKSEHVARVMDVGSLADGTPFMVMEYLEGEDLATLLSRRGKVPAAEAVLYVQHVCDALREAHSLGIIHRDVKPANLFLAKSRGRPPSVKVLDFGISKVERHDRRRTETKEILGSPWYMAPEQMKSATAADARSDVWSVGVILYELVTGEVPFDGDSMTEVIVKVLHDVPLLSNEQPAIPKELDPILRRCLAKNPEQRYQSMDALAEAVRSLEATPRGLPDAPPSTVPPVTPLSPVSPVAKSAPPSERPQIPPPPSVRPSAVPRPTVPRPAPLPAEELLALARTDPPPPISGQTVNADDVEDDIEDDIEDDVESVDEDDLEKTPDTVDEVADLVDELLDEVELLTSDPPPAAADPVEDEAEMPDLTTPLAPAITHITRRSDPAPTPVPAATATDADDDRALPTSRPTSPRTEPPRPAREQGRNRWAALAVGLGALPLVAFGAWKIFATPAPAPTPTVQVEPSPTILPAPPASSVAVASEPDANAADPEERAVILASTMEAGAKEHAPASTATTTATATTRPIVRVTDSGGASKPPAPAPAATSAAPAGDDQTIAFNVARRNHATVKATCWDTSAKSTSVVTVAASIDPSGAVTSATAMASDVNLARCVEGQVLTWTFPPSKSARTLNIPMRFRR